MSRRAQSLRRQSPVQSEPFLRYLKPGALARLRDSRISARTHRINSLIQISPLSPPSNGAQPLVNAADSFPCFESRIYGPGCPQRKKVVANKTMMLFSANQPGSTSSSDAPDPVVDLLGGDVVVAH